MSFEIILLILCAAAMHAFWNGLIKFGGNKYQAIMMLAICQGLIALMFIPFLPIPDSRAWGWLAVSTLIHTAYKVFLVGAYERGDLSRVYPLARGTAPLIVAILGLFFLKDHITGPQYSGIILLSIGVLWMAKGAVSMNEDSSLILFSLGSALCTAGYTIVDGLGARVSGNSLSYSMWHFLLDAIFFTLWSLISQSKIELPTGKDVWMKGSLAGLLSMVAYAIPVWAMTKAPIAIVAALRESSILFAMAIGIFLHGEPANSKKLMAGVLIVLAIILSKM